jgi:hypothetical protein
LRSSTSGRTKTTTKDNYGGMTGPSAWARHQEHSIQDLNFLPLGGKGGKEGTSLNVSSQRRSSSPSSSSSTAWADFEENLFGSFEEFSELERNQRYEQRFEEFDKDSDKKEKGEQEGQKEEELPEGYYRLGGYRPGIKPEGGEWKRWWTRIVWKALKRAVKVKTILKKGRAKLSSLSRTSLYFLLGCMCMGMYAWAGGWMNSKGLSEVGTARISVAPAWGQQQQQQQQQQHLVVSPDHQEKGGRQEQHLSTPPREGRAARGAPLHTTKRREDGKSGTSPHHQEKGGWQEGHLSTPPKEGRTYDHMDSTILSYGRVV